MKPTIQEIPAFYQGYVNTTTDAPLVDQLQDGKEQMLSLIAGLSESQSLYKYASDKWSIKEVLVHIMDAERVFAYRALRFAREDKTSLPGFEQNEYVPKSEADVRSLNSLREEYNATRESTIQLFKNLTDNQLQNTGVASGSTISALAVGYILVGHQNHHLSILRERYLS